MAGPADPVRRRTEDRPAYPAAMSFSSTVLNPAWVPRKGARVDPSPWTFTSTDSAKLSCPSTVLPDREEGGLEGRLPVKTYLATMNVWKR